MDKVISLGADKNTSFSVKTEKGLFTSDPFKDLNIVEDMLSFERSIREYLSTENIVPGKVACDMHPDYRSTYLAGLFSKESSGLDIIKVQHHFAHIVACMADNCIDEEVIGISFDGTGYGDDGNMWGGEFLVCSKSSFKRAYHLEYVYQPGGDIAARQGWRMALAYLLNAYDGDISGLDIDLVDRLNDIQVKTITKMIREELHAPLTSSAGRLFDAVASLTGVCDVSEYEAEGAILLEKIADKNVKDLYGYEIREGLVVLKNMITGIVEDMNRKVPKGTVSAKFHNTLGEIVFDVSNRISEESGIDKVLISGGCFQNRYLVEYLEKKFKGSDLELYKHKKYSPSDSNISVGQAIVAANS